MPEVRIAGHPIGDGHPCYIVAEIGINHNGDLAIAKKIIDVAVAAGCDAVKFQKRNPEFSVPPEQRDMLRETPWGIITYLEYRHKVEFGLDEYQEIARYCKEEGITWFASGWDQDSVDFLEQLNVPCHKIPAAALTDDSLLRHVRAKGRPIIMSTGMSTLEQVDHAVEVVGKKDLILLHCCSAYPAYYEELNLRLIPVLRDRYGVLAGYWAMRLDSRPLWQLLRWAPVWSSVMSRSTERCGDPTTPHPWSRTASPDWSETFALSNNPWAMALSGSCHARNPSSRDSVVCASFSWFASNRVRGAG